MNDDIRATLLHAMLSNQHAISDALITIATWIDEQDSPVVAQSVRESLDAVEANRKLIGSCIGRLMNPNQ
ncbi:hypothetical protein [Pseudomonas bohemica]|uniref:hypothetical protein n=1 Tax=Pseudomonas bohemica TaxID=2044872 RepID=UPI000DA62CF8|nr:hypothetical protein [Pseudomonas bohemica]